MRISDWSSDVCSSDLLEQLKFVDRPRIIAAIAEARAHGDLKENAEYHAAREPQSFTAGRIGQLEGLLSNAEVIDVEKLNPGDRVVFGAPVDLEDQAPGPSGTYQKTHRAAARAHMGT